MRLLEAMKDEEARTQRELAQALGVSEPLLGQMISQLVARGYLVENALCSDGCRGCALKKACGTDRGLRIWTLTPKGERALAGSRSDQHRP